MTASRTACTAAGLLLALVLALPPLRRAMEASMATHMLLQFPALLLAGGLLAGALPAAGLRALQRCNQLGIAGLVGSGLALALLMVPRLLDLALVDPRVEALKLLLLLATGAALRLSWQRAGTVVQAFFLGQVLPMTAVVGTLYQDTTSRVCNAYRLDDQQALGQALVWITIVTATLWLLQLGLRGGIAAPQRQAVDPGGPPRWTP